MSGGDYMKKGKVKSKKVNPVLRIKYRYLCPACTFDACYTASNEVGKNVFCDHCGKQIKLDNPNNFILL